MELHTEYKLEKIFCSIREIPQVADRGNRSVNDTNVADPEKSRRDFLFIISYLLQMLIRNINFL